jgi:hypothetical protein
VSERAALRFHVAAAILVAGVDVGAFIDARWHIHFGFTTNDFLTPTHYVLHGTWLAICALLAGYVALAARAGVPARRALPPGYGWLAIGAAAWGLAGIGDLAWHNAFGLEADVHAVYSPSHLGLNIAEAIMVFGVIRHSLWRRTTAGPSLASEIPLTVAVGVLLAGVMWLMWYSDPLSSDFAAGGAIVHGLPAMANIDFKGTTAEVAGMSGVILTALIQMLVVLFALRVLALPAAGIAVVLAWHALFKGWAMDSLVYAPAFIAAGVAGAAIASGMLRDGRITTLGCRLVGALVPSIGMTLYFVTIVLFVGPIVWPAHLVTGAVALSGLAGLAISWIVVPPDLLPRAAE